MSDLRAEVLGRARKTREIIGLIQAERQTVAARPALAEIVEADCAYLDFFIEFFDESARELEAIGAQLETAVAGERHAERLRAIAAQAADGRRRCLDFFDAVSLEIGDELVRLQGLNDVAEQIAPKAATPIDRRALLGTVTRFFRR